MKKNLLIIALGIFILTSATAIAGNNEKNIGPIGCINFTDRVVYILDHTSDPAEGNWITMGCPYEGRTVRLPQPITVIYSGPKYKDYGGVSGTLYREENESYKITYPSTSPYLTHPVYLPGEKVNMSFHGEPCLEGEVEIYLFKVASDSAYGIFDAFKAGDIENLDSLFHSNMDENYKKYFATLGKNGDLLDYNFGPLEPGQYCIVMIQENENSSLTVLSATAFVVSEYELRISAPESIIKGENLDISMALEGAPDESNCTYGAVLIREEAYKANIKINSDGTKNGTSVIVNEVDLIDEFDINSSNYRSKLTRDELQTEIQTMVGEGKGSIAIGEKGQKILSLTAFDLPKGCYYLFVGAYNPEKGLVGLTQLEVEIKSKVSSNNGKGSGNAGSEGSEGSGGSGGGAGGSPEPPNNVKIKEICQQFISNGNNIKFKFTQDATCIDYIELRSKKTVGKTTTIIEELKEKSMLTQIEPEGEIYKYINIWLGNEGYATANNIENASVGFKVDKEWINGNHINIDTLTLQHFSGKKWNPLPTKQVKEDEGYIYFEAETSSFSPFAITAKKNIMMIEEKTGETRISSEVIPQNEPSMTIDSGMISQEAINSDISKIVSFSVGFLIIILIGTVVKKKNKS